MLRELVGGLPRTFWALFCALLVNRAGAFAMILLPTYLTTGRGTSLAVAGLVTSGYGAGGAVGTLLGGVQADPLGKAQDHLTGTIAAAILMLALGFAKPLWMIATLAVLIGLMHMLPSPAMVAAIVDVTPEKDRPRAFNLQFWAFNMGAAIAAALAGIVAEFSFFALFAIDAGMTALTAVLIWRLVRPVALGRLWCVRRRRGDGSSARRTRTGAAGVSRPCRSVHCGAGRARARLRGARTALMSIADPPVARRGLAA